MAEGGFAAGPGKSDPSRCTGSWDGSIWCDHVSVSCRAGGPMGAADTLLRAPLFVFIPSRQQEPPSCATVGVDEGEVLSGVAEVLAGPPALPGKQVGTSMAAGDVLVQR